MLLSLGFAQVESTPQITTGTPVFPSKATANRAMWDLKFQFDATDGGMAAVATDGSHFYTANFQATAPNYGKISRYTMDGVPLATFTIPEVGEIRCLTYDGNYFYAGAGSHIRILDLNSQTQIGTIPNLGGGTVRHLSYDPMLDDGEGGFWLGDWTTIRAISKTGQILLPNSAVANVFGSAYDNYSDPENPCLWLFTQRGYIQDVLGVAKFEQFNIATRTLTGVTHDAKLDYENPNVVGDLAGGACSFKGDDGKFYLAGSIQRTPNLLLVYELAEIPPSCPQVTNLQTEIQGTDVKLTWTAAPDNPTGYKIYKGITELATVTATEYVITKLPDGEHKFAVSAIYNQNCIPEKVATTVNIKSGSPIKNLNGNCIDGNITLTWDAPNSKDLRAGITIQQSGEPTQGVGNNTEQIIPANRWTPQDLANLGIASGMVLEKVAFAPWEPARANFTIKVWQGGSWSGSTGNPGTELVSMEVSPESLEARKWNTIDITPPLVIDATKELWIGYHTKPTEAGYHSGADELPMINNKGNICYVEGWTTMSIISDGGLSNNWCIRGFVSGDPLVELYHIYQDNVKFGETTATTFTKAGVTGNHNYGVATQFINGASSEKVSKMLNCNLNTPIHETTTPSIYPNPATHNITIKTDSTFNKIEVLNFLGQLVISRPEVCNNTTLDVSHLTNGIYFVRVISETGVNVQKFVKQ